MAPGFADLTIIDTRTSTYTCTGNYYGYSFTFQQKKVESKKDRIARIAKEKMLASHKTYNQKTPTIKHIKQVCKPAHRIGAFRR